MTDEEETAMTNEELIGAMMEEYHYSADVGCRPSVYKKGMTSALAVAKPEIERALLRDLIDCCENPGYEQRPLTINHLYSIAKERGIDLEEKT